MSRHRHRRARSRRRTSKPPPARWRLPSRVPQRAGHRTGRTASRDRRGRSDATTDRVPFRGVRKAIADHLRYSVSHAVHYTVMDEADVTALDDLRRRLVAASNEKIRLLPFVAVAVCRVLSGRRGRQFRRLNSTVDDDRQEIVQHRAVHLGIATDTEAGLMVPVIRDAHRMGVLEISRQIAELAKAARERSHAAARLTGSTFTISNFGCVGGRFGTPIINYPEAAILAVGRAREGVVVRDGMLGVGKLLPLSLSADHRVIDGATAATALAKIIELLQKPDDLLPPVIDDCRIRATIPVRGHCCGPGRSSSTGAACSASSPASSGAGRPARRPAPHPLAHNCILSLPGDERHGHTLDRDRQRRQARPEDAQDLRPRRLHGRRTRLRSRHHARDSPTTSSSATSISTTPADSRGGPGTARRRTGCGRARASEDAPGVKVTFPNADVYRPAARVGGRDGEQFGDDAALTSAIISSRSAIACG